MSNFDLVRDFHEKFNQAIDKKLDPSTQDLRSFRENLIYEEAEEVYDELNPDPINWPISYSKERLTKELCDLLYVVYGTGVTFGLPLDEAFKLVHESNMSKLDENGRPIYREDGKVLKGPNYKPVDLGVLFID